MIQTRLKHLLFSKQESIVAIAPDLAIYFKGMLVKPTPKVIKALQDKFHEHKKRNFEVVDLISTNSAEESTTLDKIETQGICEQIILYNLYKRIEARGFLRPQQLELLSKLFSELGIYSFEWMNYESKKLIKIFSTQPLGSEKSDEAFKKLSLINRRLPNIFWCAGYVQAVITQLEILDVIVKNDLDNNYLERKKTLLALGLHNLSCARKLLHHPYSEKVFATVVVNKDIKNLLSPCATRDLIPDGNEALINLIEKQITIQMGNKG